MRLSLVFGLGMAGVAAAGAIGLAISISSSSSSSSSIVSSSSSARVSAEASRGAGAAEPSSSSSGEPRPTSADEAVPSEAEAGGALEEERARQVAALEAAARGGPRDSWAVATEPALAEQLRGILTARELGLQLTEVRCSARLCRVELASPDHERAVAGLSAIGELLPWKGERLLRASPGDRPTLVLLAAREHTTLLAALE